MDLGQTIDHLSETLTKNLSAQVTKRVEGALTKTLVAERDMLQKRVISLQDTLQEAADSFGTIAARLRSVLHGTNGTSKNGHALKNGDGDLRAGRKLNMRCRVQGCLTRSRGPRYGFICDDHRKKLSKREQKDARATWYRKHQARA